MTAKPFGLAVKAVIADGSGRSLLIRRSASNRHFVGQWEWPGGKVDPGESFDVAALREVKEETGLDVELTGLAGAVEFEMPARRIIVLCLEARLLGGELKLSEEHDDSTWVKFSDYGRYEFTDNVRELVMKYAARKAAG